MHKTMMLSLFAITLALTACGGGGGSEITPIYGAIAVNSTRADAGIATGFPSQNDADFRAIQDCGNTQACTIVKRFNEARQCAVLAFSVNGSGGIVAYGVEANKSAAETSALRNCVSQGGNYCELWKYACQ
ncbi:DUF4189 domain-containing protein [Limnohabitans sp. B9-3]|uniref:DUF4189 domain-containing protein n=1 Tax=Limnohabitans sp. B9-3 TaxID=1100707 RepID=UPI000C1E71D0|nr:DUF4189 domain-containing protein [Limnohabitans sp. B9-3]PIT78542.1 hypothetical protein B9Z42_00095 [Limnohabitans sp. B9-3]